MEPLKGGGYEPYGPITHQRATLASAAVLVRGPGCHCCQCPDAADAHVAGRLTLPRIFECAVDEDRRIERPQVPHGRYAASRYRAIFCRGRTTWRFWLD